MRYKPAPHDNYSLLGDREPEHIGSNKNSYREQKNNASAGTFHNELRSLRIDQFEALWPALKPYQRCLMAIIRDYAYDPLALEKLPLVEDRYINSGVLPHFQFTLLRLHTTIPLSVLLYFNIQFPINRIMHSLSKLNFEKVYNTWLAMLRLSIDSFEQNNPDQYNHLQQGILVRLLFSLNGATPILNCTPVTGINGDSALTGYLKQCRLFERQVEQAIQAIEKESRHWF